jgi:hypothetical protein
MRQDESLGARRPGRGARLSRAQVLHGTLSILEECRLAQHEVDAGSEGFE